MLHISTLSRLSINFDSFRHFLFVVTTTCLSFWSSNPMNPTLKLLMQQAQEAQNNLEEYKKRICLECDKEKLTGTGTGWWSCQKCLQADRPHLFCPQHQTPDLILGHVIKVHSHQGSKGRVSRKE